MEKVGIIGFGFVGRAIVHGFKDRVQFFINDPKFEDSVPVDELVRDCDLIFVGVPTPMNIKTGRIDTVVMDEVVEVVYNAQVVQSKQPIVVIKSTVTPDALLRYRDDNKGLRLVMNPEFLTEKHAYLDFLNQTRIVLGGEKEDVEVVGNFYKNNGFFHVPQWYLSLESAALVKYMCNTFLATKLSFANEWYQLIKEIGLESEWEEIIGAFLGDGRIGNSHVSVPGPDGQLGWGGKCLVGSEVVCVKSLQTGLSHIMPIEELASHYSVQPIKEFDQIATCDLSSQSPTLTYRPLIGVSQREVEETIKIQAAKGYRWETTLDHRFNVLREGAFVKVKAKDVQVGDQLPIVFQKEEASIGSSVKLSLLSFEVFSPRFLELQAPLDRAIVEKAYRTKVITYDQKRRLEKNSKIIPFCIWKAFASDLAKENSPIRFGDSTHFEYMFPIEWEIDEDFAELVGFYLAEGNVTNNQTFFSFNVLEEEYISRVKQLLGKFDFTWSERIQKWNDKPSCHVIRVHAYALSLLLKEILGCGVNCYEKRFPTLLLNHKRLAWSCFEGFFKGDGSLYGAGRLSKYITLNLASASKTLIEQLAWLLRSEEIFPSYTEKGNSYQLDISLKQDIEKLLRKIDLLEEEKVHIAKRLEQIKQIKGQKHSDHAGHLKLIEVVKVVKQKKTCPVYSLEVEDTQQFVTSGGLVISNCLPKDLNAIVNYAEQRHGVDMQTLKAAWQTNLKVRKEKDWENIEGATSNGR